MKKRTSVLFAAAVAAIVMTGCTTVETTSSFNGLGVTERRSQPIAHINARVSGAFLFDVFPVFCGSVNNIDKVAAFVNTVSLENTMGLVSRHARGLGATKLVDISSYQDSYWMWYTILLWKRYTQVSATAIK
ncbi:MAG: hypothetical protein PHV82_13705 [Victivallaceae bacterium]|nr:hypothetical protein [Victivallaceae bacterium]